MYEQEIFDWFNGRDIIKKLHTKHGKTTRELLRPEWEKYGLSIWDHTNRKHPDEIVNGIKNHDLVQQYLDTHPTCRAKYKSDPFGELNYYTVLKLAEKDAHDSIASV